MATHENVMATILATHERVMLACLDGADMRDDEPTETQDAEWFELDLPQPPSEALTPAPAATPAPALEPPAPAPAPAPPAAREEQAAQIDAPGLAATLAELIAERTGYPADAVGLDTDLQGELGIDSIKKVEILGMFQRTYGFGTGERPSAMESLSPARTPRQAIEALLGLLGSSGTEHTNCDGTAARIVPVAEGAP
jgi:3-oxoacyl-ACP reductase-like protein